MIRNVVLGRLHPDVPAARVEEALAALARVRVDGLLEMRVGRDAGLRAGTWDYAITVDLADADAYRRYDQDEEHDRVRRELFDPISEQIARAQFPL
ncbi:Dabb family protein [Quadrisphaera sp. DSM 44207]|uniref:Dabb family protein n=1 Tax=Quadrisphaera sp. DSM 44207 TaxID=1881057 RepID=UPI0008823C6B|nr:Dabb family protein [Quadrisphaera sp. DSM 44207]SDQ63576.1 Stress responsive A/B Barrel Domain [Quadrisphaera sp. DSM 44207]